MNIVFHKTHKCSSSSIQNILLRFARKHELDIVLPKTGNYLSFGSDLFKVESLRDTPWQRAGIEYNLFCLHNRWNGAEVRKIMKRQDENLPVYFTILREPVELFVSLWDYMDLGKITGNKTLEEFALSIRDGHTFMLNRVDNSFGQNQMLWDFGLDPHLFDDDYAVQSKIEEIESDFDLVLVTEHFDISMVLLKHLLCWNYSDLSSLKLNAHEPSTKSKLSDEARQALKSWLQADYKLYNHFQDKLLTTIKQFGSGDQIVTEIEAFHQANEKAQAKCNIKQVENKDLDPEQRWYGHGVLAYKLNKDIIDEECRFMAMNELKFLDYLRNLQIHRLENREVA